MKIAVNYMSSCALLLCAAAAFAQQPTTADAPAKPADSAAAQPKPSKATAQSEAGEPRANTSAPVPSTPRAAAAAAPSAAGPGAAAPAAAQKSSSAADKLQLGTATVTGDREQPKVMYVVPWKKSDIGDLGGKPMNSLVDEILAPVDRDVFKREVSYYQTVNSEASQNGAQPPAGQGEK
jgi:hypothetical protein